MKVELKLIDNIKLDFELNSVRYQLKNNILADRTRRALTLNSKVIYLHTIVKPTKYTKFIDVYTAAGEKVVINKESPTELKGDFKFVIKKKTIDVKKTVFFKIVKETSSVLEKEVLLENLEISSNSVFKTRDLQKALTKSQNIVHFGSKLQFEPLNSQKIKLDIQGLIIFEQLLANNPLRYTKYVVVEITQADKKMFFGANKTYIMKLLTNISKKLSLFVYTDLTLDDKAQFAHYEKLATAVLYETNELMTSNITAKTKALKIDVQKVKNNQLEFTLNDLAQRNVVTSYQGGITVVVEKFEQLIQAISENLSDCICQSQYLNLETKFNLTLEELNVISSFRCQNILLNSDVNFEHKPIVGNTNIILANNFPKYTNADKSTINEMLNKDLKNVIFIADVINPSVSVIDGNLIVKMEPQNLISTLKSFENINVVGYNNDLIELLHNVTSTINYNVTSLNKIENLDVFTRQMWKIIGMSNLQFNFNCESDYNQFNESINVNQIACKYSIAGKRIETSGENYFEIDGQQQPIVVKQTANSLKILKDAAYIIVYHNELMTNTIDISVDGVTFQLTNKALLHLPAGTTLDTKDICVSIYCTGNPYSSNIFKRYRNEWIVNSSLEGEYVANPNCYLGDYFENYAGIYISPSTAGQMYATNLTLKNKDQINELYSQLLQSDKLIYILVDDNSEVTNIITTYNIISNLEFSVLASQDEVYQLIEKRQLWDYVEVIR